MSAPVASYLHIHDQLSVILMGVVLGLGVALPALRSILQGVQNYVQFAASSTIEALGKAFLAVWFVSMGYGLAGAVAAIVVRMSSRLPTPRLRCWAKSGRESVVFTSIFGAWRSRPPASR